MGRRPDILKERTIPPSHPLIKKQHSQGGLKRSTLFKCRTPQPYRDEKWFNTACGNDMIIERGSVSSTPGGTTWGNKNEFELERSTYFSFGHQLRLGRAAYGERDMGGRSCPSESNFW
uniref:Uncharacterized protein n=1 Tax=Micrurus paraensis TaxID=1970185 RepID=A0A2D4KUR9_9SAUR